MGLFDGTSLERAVTCAVCGAEVAACNCPKGADGVAVRLSEVAVRVRRERRRGKWVTVVAGLDPGVHDAAGLLKSLKAAVASGGSVAADGFELQGDHAEKAIAFLKAAGFTGSKRAGG